MAKFTEERGRGGACLHSECPRPASGLPFPHGPAPPLVAAESRPVRQRSALRRREVRAGPTALDQRLLSESRGAGSGRRFVLPFPLPVHSNACVSGRPVVQKLALEDGPSTVSLLGSLSLSWSLKRNAPSVSSARAGTGTNRLARGSGCVCSCGSGRSRTAW
jgi:hypothetical protein